MPTIVPVLTASTILISPDASTDTNTRFLKRFGNTASSPGLFDPDAIKRDVGDNWALKLTNVKKVRCAIPDFVQNQCYHVELRSAFLVLCTRT